MRINYFFNKRLGLLLHFLGWSVLLLLPHYIINVYGDGNTAPLHHLYTETLVFGVFFYLNYLLLVPRLFFNGKRLNYFLLIIFIISALMLLLTYLNNYVFFDPEKAKEFDRVMNEIHKGGKITKPPFREFKVYGYFYTSILVWGFSLGLSALEQFSKNEKQRKELEKEKLDSELSLLKNQVSPHFFFNTLNNIYSLIGMDAEQAQDSVHKLSKLMRYLLYESEKNLSALDDEITFLKHYIDLMKLRLTDNVAVSVSFPKDTKGIGLPPLLFIPFVENAFKHGISNREKSFVHISLKVEEHALNFVVRNSKVSSTSNKSGVYSGIGLNNVQKRLDLIYPNRHHLEITDTESQFEVKLGLELL
jgi:sensor histidine kinase YesM